MSEQEDIKKIFNTALSNLTAGYLDQAKEGFMKVININPRSSEAFLNLGNVFFLENDIDNAIKNNEIALELDPTLVKAYINLGNCHFKKENYADAIGYWNVASKIEPNKALIHQNIAVAYEKIGNPQKAFRHYEAFLKCNTKNDKVSMQIRRKVEESKRVGFHNLNAGVTFQKQKKFSEAALAYKKSIECYPNFSKAHLNLGSIFYKSEKIDEAITCWEQALRLEPTHANTHCNLAIAYDRKQMYDEAFYHYKLYLEHSQGRSKDAPQVKERVDELQNILIQKRELIRQHLKKGDELFKKKFYEEAILEYQKYLSMNPGGADSQTVTRKIDEAKTRLNPVEKAAEIALQMGDEYFSASLFDKAVTAYNRYLSLCPKGGEVANVKRKIDQCHKSISNVVSAMLKSD